MANIQEILARAAALRDETQLNSINPERAGGIMYDTLIALNELWLSQGAALVISKIYASVAAMQADTSPVSDLSGRPLLPGQIVVIASSDSDNGKVYRYNGAQEPSWSLVGEIGNLVPVDNLESDSTSLPLAARQGKVLDGKVSQLGQKLIKLTGFGIYADEAGAVNVGDVFYNPSTRLLQKREAGNVIVTVPFYDGAIYTCNGLLYIWNGSDLISQEGLLNLQQKGLTTTYENKSYINCYFDVIIPAGSVYNWESASGTGIYLIPSSGADPIFVIKQNFPYTSAVDIFGYIPINNATGTITVKGFVDSCAEKFIEIRGEIGQQDVKISNLADFLPLDYSFINKSYQPIVLDKPIAQGTKAEYTGSLYVYDSQNTEVLWSASQSPTTAPFDIVKVIPITNSVTIHIDGYAYSEAQADDIFVKKNDNDYCTGEEVTDMLDARLANVNYGPITINGSGVTKNAAAYGFLPTATAADNATALQTCLNGGGLILIDFPGVYEIGSTLFVDTNTTIMCGAGVFLKRAVNANTGTVPRHIFVNRGAPSRLYNSNISLYNLRIIPDASLSAGQDAELVVGLRGLVSMFYVKNLIIDGFEIIDHEYEQYALQVCTFENIQLRNIHIETLKDGIHFGRGRGFVVEHCKFLTNDDALAFNSVDYPASNAEAGWIEDGIVRDMTFLAKPANSDFTDKRGVLLLTGAWKDWHSGNTYKVYGDYCVNDGRLYQSMGPLSNDTIVSTNAPTHASGVVTYADGLTWLMKQDNGVGYTAGVRRIAFEDIYFYRATTPMFLFSSESSMYMRAIYPNAESFKNTDISFNRIFSIGASTALIAVGSPIDRIKVDDSILGEITSAIISLTRSSADTPTNMNVNFSLIGNYYANVPLLSKAAGDWAATINIVGSMSNGHTATFEGITPTVINNDLA